MSSSPIPPDQETPDASIPAALKPLPRWFPLLFFTLLSALFLGRSLFTRDVFLPAGLLGHVAPYKAMIPVEAVPPWNPLRWDAVAQFYPWRFFAAQSLRSGILPLWNPYQFCGTPFVANSQSAVFYPPNLLFALLSTIRAFAVSAALHLTLCGWFTYLLLRRLRCGEWAALFGGAVFAFSAWQIQWLQLPTFLATSCWLPLIFKFVYELHEKKENRRGGAFPLTAGFWLLAISVGLMLLAGHLQIAFYGLLAAVVWAIALSIASGKRNGIGTALSTLAKCAAALLLGLMLASPQILPALELSHVSHRAGTPTAAGYAAYTEYALAPSQLVTLALPNFYGNDFDPHNKYWGYYVKNMGETQIGIRHNAAETAAYVGILPLLLAIFALVRGLSKRTFDRLTTFFALLALLALLMALGTPIDAAFYFGVPGFGQSGSPGRILVLWAFAVSTLAAFGLDSLLKTSATAREKQATAGISALLFAISLSVAARQFGASIRGIILPTLGDVFSNVAQDWARIALIVVGAVLLFSKSLTLEQSKIQNPKSKMALLLVIVDLFWAGIPVNPTSAPENVYPVTPGIKFVQERTGHERVLPVNQLWSLYQSPPAVLPPNGAMVFGLHDVQGYDSLLTRQYKEFANQFARPTPSGFTDASPAEVGNMVFFQNPNTPLTALTGAKFAITPATGDSAFRYLREGTPPGSPLYDAANEMAVYALPPGRSRAALLANGVSVGAAQWVADGPTRVVLKTDAPIWTTLILADQFYPGWKVSVDGQPAPIDRAADAPIFRAVSLPAGPHTVAFRYEPASIRLGIYLAGFACLLIFVPLGVRLTFRPLPAVTNFKNVV